MAAARNKNDLAPRAPLWHRDARERMGVLLPELAISIVGATSATILLGYDGSPAPVVIPWTLAVLALAQVFTQTVLYTFTYLSNDLRMASVAWMIVVACTLAWLFVWQPGPGMSGVYLSPVVMMMGLAMFYLTRSRPGFILLIVEVIAISYYLTVPDELIPFHLVCYGSYLALFVMRSSAARITLDYVSQNGRTTGDGDTAAASPPLGNVYGQVAAFAAAAGALCLAVSLIGIPLWAHTPESDEAASSSTAAPDQEERSGGAEGNAQGTGGDAADADAGREDANADGAASADASGDAASDDAPGNDAIGDGPGDGEKPAADHEATGTGRGTADGAANGGARGRGAREANPFNALILLLVPVIVALPFLVRLVLRKKARRDIEREPLEIDRVAKIYLGIISQLQAAGIVREEWETPREFLNLNTEELAKLTEPAGLDHRDWSSLTSAYEQARYANMAPTDSELATCWSIYDALPTCTRQSIGWFSYLTEAFWRM